MPSLPTLLRPTIPASCRRALKWDSISAVLAGLSGGAIGPFFGVIARQDMHASNFWLAVLSSSGSTGNLLNPLVAHHIRKKPKLPYVIWPMALARLGFFLVPFAFCAPFFILIGFANNFISTLAGPASHSILRDAYPAERRGRLMSFVRVLAVLGGLVGAALGGRLLLHYDYTLIFPLMAVVGLASVAAFTRIGVGCSPEEDAAPQMRFWESVAIVRKDPAFKLYCTFFYLYGFGNMMSGPVVTMVQVDQLHITKQWVSYLAISSSISSMAGYYFWGRVVDRKGPFRMMYGVIALLTLFPLTYLFAGSVPLLLIASCSAGFAWAGGDLGYANAALRFGKRESVAAYAGMFAFLQACRGIPAPFLGAFLADYVGPRPVFLVILVFYLAALAVLLFTGALKIEMKPE